MNKKIIYISILFYHVFVGYTYAFYQSGPASPPSPPGDGGDGALVRDVNVTIGDWYFQLIFVTLFFLFLFMFSKKIFFQQTHKQKI